MKKIICKVEYDTEASTLVAKFTEGQFGDPTGYEETLYVTEGGKYFLYVNGGEESVHAKEDIKRMSAAKAEEWKAEHSLYCLKESEVEKISLFFLLFFPIY